MKFGVFAMGVGESFKDEPWWMKFEPYPAGRRGYL
jgi:hypothetical protein